MNPILDNHDLAIEESQLVEAEIKLTGRLDRLRRHATRCRITALEMIHRAGSGHIGSSMSCVDIVSVLKFDQMNWQSSVERSQSDVFILSKGHAAPAWYAALIESGDIDPELADRLRDIDSPLQGHPDRVRLPEVDASTGALGQGLSIAAGRAEAKRLKAQGSYVFCLLGDGELQEGQNWEAAMYAGARRLSNLVAIVDHNHRQSDGGVADILDLHPLTDKFRSFRWQVQEVDGHSHLALREAVINAKREAGRPSVIIAHTRKGLLRPGRVLLDGGHGGKLTDTEFAEAIGQLRRSL